MNGKKHGPAHRHVVVRRPTAEEIAARYADALRERARWRAEKAAGPRSRPKVSAAESAARERAAFAEGIARAEFGRFYWDRKRSSARRRPRTAAAGMRESRARR